MPDEGGPLTFTQAVQELEAAGYDSEGFSVEEGRVACMDCRTDHAAVDVPVGGMLHYQLEDGDGFVLAMKCPSCGRKGLLFEGAEHIDGKRLPADQAVIDTLVERVRV